MKALAKFFCLVVLVSLILTNCENPELAPGTGQEELKAARAPKPPPYKLAESRTQLQVYGVWHAGNDYCTWGSVRDMADFEKNNGWLIDRGDGNPSVNLVVLSFVNPLKLLNKADDATTLDGIPVGMTPDVVNFFKDHGIRVMLSIGGITYTDSWNAALAKDAWQLGINAADVAGRLGVGIEIDYEQNSSPNLAGLQSFIDAYRSVHPYDQTGVNHAARLTIDLAAGDRWLIDICREATAKWLSTENPVLDYANAMVPARQPSTAGAIENWDEHIDGKPQYAPPILPLAPCKFTGALFINGTKSIAECVNFYSSIQYLNREYVTRVMSPLTEASHGMLGYMFWAAECPSTRSLCTTGKNSCEGGVGEGAKFFNIPVPMPALRAF
jgi:hypothetical protein